MEIWQAIVLGAVQGFAEFLPVSSSGHLILFQHLFGIREHALFYSVTLHLGTLIPVIFVLRRDIAELFKKPFDKLLYLTIATIPAGALGLILTKTTDLDALFSERLILLAAAFAFTAAELLLAEKIAKSRKSQAATGCPLNFKTALSMGVGQAVGVFPGISRSGTTAAFGVFAGTDRDVTARFSFLMSVPVILAAAFTQTLDCVKSGGISDVSALPIISGVLTAAITGYIAIEFMLKIIRKADYKWFSLYLAVISAVTVITAVAERV